jgi:hypothetical protein
MVLSFESLFIDFVTSCITLITVCSFQIAALLHNLFTLRSVMLLSLFADQRKRSKKFLKVMQTYSKFCSEKKLLTKLWKNGGKKIE